MTSWASSSNLAGGIETSPCEILTEIVAPIQLAVLPPSNFFHARGNPRTRAHRTAKAKALVATRRLPLATMMGSFA